MSYIYKITNTINDKLYIGQTTETLTRRFSRHISCSKENNSSGMILYKAFRKHGIENFKIELVEECETDNLCEKEEFWIKNLNTIVPLGYNVLSGGKLMCGENNPFYGKTHSDENKTLMSHNASKRKGELNPFHNKQHSIETKEKISAINSKNHKEKKNTKEYHVYIEHMRKLNLDNNPFKGKRHTEESKDKMSQRGRLKNVTAITANNEKIFFEDIESAIDYVVVNNFSNSKRTSIRSRIRDCINYDKVGYSLKWYKNIHDDSKGAT